MDSVKAEKERNKSISSGEHTCTFIIMWKKDKHHSEYNCVVNTE